MISTGICIIGAGPAGAAAALQLAVMGIPSVIVDKAVFPRDKVCGDGLSGKVLTLLTRIDKEIGERLRQSLLKLDSWGITFSAPNRIGMHIMYKPRYQKLPHEPHGLVCKRIDFDNFLVEELKRRPEIQLLEGRSIERYELQPDGYLLTDRTGQFAIKARLVIVANGAHSGFTKEVAGIRMEPEHYAAGVRAYYRNVQGLHPDHFLELHFLKSMLPGYLWLFPLPGGEVNVGVGMLSKVARQRKVDLKKLMADTLEQDPVMKERFRYAERMSDIKGYGLPFGSKDRVLSGERYMLTGDAASLINPFTGEGIGNALHSGCLAAKQAAQALAANDCSAAALAGYDASIRRVLRPELLLSAKLQKMVHYPWFINLVIKQGARNQQLQELLSGMFHEETLRKKLQQPSFYFKLLMGWGVRNG